VAFADKLYYINRHAMESSKTSAKFIRFVTTVSIKHLRTEG
jgi:hypothetical protein